MFITNIIWNYWIIFQWVKCEINKGKPFKMEMGGQRGEISNSATNCRPNREDSYLASPRQDYFTTPAAEKVLLPQQQSSWWEATVLWTFSLLHGLFVYNSSFQLSPFLQRRAFLSFDLWTFLWLCHSLLVLSCNSLWPPNKPIFAGKITKLFLRLKELTYLLYV